MVILGCWLLHEKFSFCPKIMALPELGAAAPPQAPWLVRSASEQYHQISSHIDGSTAVWF